MSSHIVDLQALWHRAAGVSPQGSTPAASGAGGGGTGGSGIVALQSLWQGGDDISPMSAQPRSFGRAADRPRDPSGPGEPGIVDLQSFWQTGGGLSPLSSSPANVVDAPPAPSADATSDLLMLLGASPGGGGGVSPQGNTPSGSTSSGTASGSGAVPPASAPDDLRMIEGIGPKISELLVNEGIATFTQLAQTPLSRLQEILQEASLRMVDPSTWPQQAQLAATGQWPELEQLQDELRAGRA